MKFALSALCATSLFFAGCTAEAATPAGKYSLEIDAATIAAAEKSLEAAPEAMKAMAQSAIDGLKKMTGTFELKADNTFTASMSMPTGEMTMKGTWKLDGDQVTMSSTHQDGKESVETKVGTWKDGNITVVENQGGQEVKMVMKRQ